MTTPGPELPTQVVVRRVRELREGRGWSAARLAAELEKVGLQRDKSIIANLENGRRSYVSVDEWLALAVALDVTPAALLVDLQADRAAVTPSIEVLPYQLLAWLWSRDPLPGRPLQEWVDGKNQAKAVDTWSLLEATRRIEDRYDEQLPRIVSRYNRMLRSAVEELSAAGVAVPREITDYLAEHPDETP